MIIKKHILSEKEITVFLPNEYTVKKKYSVLYFHDGDELEKFIIKIMNEVYEISPCATNYIIVGIQTQNRIHDLTPWPSNSIISKFNDFGGKGEEYIDFIKNILIPFINLNYSTLTDPEHTSVGGISLGGLISIFSLYKYNLFGNIISISGSFWYKDWCNYIKNNSLKNNKTNIFMIVGDSEGNGKPNPLNNIVEYTKNTFQTLKNQSNGKIDLFFDSGSHHSNRKERLLKSLLWLFDLKVTSS